MEGTLPVKNLDEWIGGFIGERLPENEVRIWEAIAVVFGEVCREVDLSGDEKKKLYFLLVMESSGYYMAGIEETIPPGVPGLKELAAKWQRAFRAGERP